MGEGKKRRGTDTRGICACAMMPVIPSHGYKKRERWRGEERRGQVRSVTFF